MLLLTLTGCTGTLPSPDPTDTSGQDVSAVVLASPDATQRQVVTGTPVQASVHMSAALFEASPVAVGLAPPPGAPAGGPDPARGPAAAAAAGLGVPRVLVGPDGEGSADATAELDRLGAGTVIADGDPAADWEALAGSRELPAGPTEAAAFQDALGFPAEETTGAAAGFVDALGRSEREAPQVVRIEGDAATVPGGTPEASGEPSEGTALADRATTTDLPDFRAATDPSDALVLATGSSAPASVATARAAGADVELLPEGDPRTGSAAVQAVHEHTDTAVLALGDEFGTQEEFAVRAAAAATGVELPAGGQTVFPGRRMGALYGHPSGPYLGALGEQGIDETMVRVQALAEQYRPFSDEPVIPALDLIATVAGADPGADGSYSNRTPVDELRPWVDAAEAAGVYVVLDFQSGGSDFLSQVREYEELLVRPSVGLALDPEWRLAPGQRPLQQIGTVSAAEINEASAWLADLTRDNALPQKLLMVHQFRIDMITDREDLDVSRTELAVTLHADGHGTPGQKLDTWNVLQSVPPAGIWPSWKNFYDEDQPMLTPEQTYSVVEPKPWLVTYQ
ncbi:hypothetical protein [Arthrobacter sp. RIT-PI-e]|uniref:hypothetical protein n=1 Tax=Arthrobacter sp. RIT-PI-e TaxID=1681197 RepID=UPI000676046E|nr:hypothetical protein [Arthrobacter sp. RIT-PI-e]